MQQQRQQISANLAGLSLAFCTNDQPFLLANYQAHQQNQNGFNLDGYCLCESREGRVNIRVFIAALSYSLEGFSFSSSLLDDLIRDR